jgi:hypothetical protein
MRANERRTSPTRGDAAPGSAAARVSLYPTMGCIAGERHNKGHPQHPNGAMNDERLSVLCNELRNLARLSPGINPPSALRVRAIAQEIQGSVDSKGTDICADAIAIMEGFQTWFSRRKWNVSGDEGRHVRVDIFASILKLEGAVSRIHGCRIAPTRAWHR